MPTQGYNGPATEFDQEVALAFQHTMESIGNQNFLGLSSGGFAIVLKCYSDRNACDVRTSNGAIKHNVPIMTEAGVIGGEVWGTMNLPQEGDLVIIDMVGGLESQPVIVGTIIPFLHNTFQSGNPVNSNDKQFTKKLLEAGKENYYRKVFKQGLTVEVQADATVIVEKPDGTYFKLNDDGSFEVQDGLGNMIQSSSSGVEINKHLMVSL